MPKATHSSAPQVADCGQEANCGQVAYQSASRAGCVHGGPLGNSSPSFSFFIYFQTLTFLFFSYIFLTPHRSFPLLYISNSSPFFSLVLYFQLLTFLFLCFIFPFLVFTLTWLTWWKKPTSDPSITWRFCSGNVIGGLCQRRIVPWEVCAIGGLCHRRIVP